jgi:hypothetical protein
MYTLPVGPFVNCVPPLLNRLQNESRGTVELQGVSKLAEQLAF